MTDALIIRGQPAVRCSVCIVKDPATDCDWCGGSGYRRKCHHPDCVEHGCSGYGECFVSVGEIDAGKRRPSLLARIWRWFK